MIAVNLYQSIFILKSLFNCIIILLAQIFYIYPLPISILSSFFLNFGFFARLSVSYRQKIKLGFQKMAAGDKIIFIM